LLAISGGVVFLFQNFDYQTGPMTPIRFIFVFCFCAGVVILVIASGFFVRAFYNHVYKFLPDSSATAQYKSTLEETYKEFPEKDILVSDALDKYLTDYFVEYAASNTKVNDKRSAYIHSCNGAIIGAALLFMVAYLAFCFGDLDRGKMKPAIEISVTKPIDVHIRDKGK
jgi:hypothetical protein